MFAHQTSFGIPYFLWYKVGGNFKKRKKTTTFMATAPVRRESNSVWGALSVPCIMNKTTVKPKDKCKITGVARGFPVRLVVAFGTYPDMFEDLSIGQTNDFSLIDRGLL